MPSAPGATHGRMRSAASPSSRTSRFGPAFDDAEISRQRQRNRARRCKAHLKDLQAHHAHACGEQIIAPGDLLPTTIARAYQACSMTGSPAAMCAELAGNEG